MANKIPAIVLDLTQPEHAHWLRQIDALRGVSRGTTRRALRKAGLMSFQVGLLLLVPAPTAKKI